MNIKVYIFECAIIDLEGWPTSAIIPDQQALHKARLIFLKMLMKDPDNELYIKVMPITAFEDQYNGDTLDVSTDFILFDYEEITDKE